MDKKQIAVALLKVTLNLDKKNIEIANHVKDCEHCLSIYDEASNKCVNHYEECKI